LRYEIFPRYEFEGFIMSEVPLTIKPKDMEEVKRMMAKAKR
jgi:hypothetical protein